MGGAACRQSKKEGGGGGGVGDKRENKQKGGERVGHAPLYTLFQPRYPTPATAPAAPKPPTTNLRGILGKLFMLNALESLYLLRETACAFPSFLCSEVSDSAGGGGDSADFFFSP